MTCEVFTTVDRVRMREAIGVRIAVFVDEQRIPEEEEVDAHDATEDRAAVHVLLRSTRGEAIATGRFYDAGADTAQIGRMAVRAGLRGRGLGRRVLERLLCEARERRYRRGVLHAQVSAVGFYRKFGFTPFGETLIDGGIVHQPMERWFLVLD